MTTYAAATSPHNPSPLALLKPYVFIMGLGLVMLSAFRVGYIAWQWDRVAASQGLGFLLLQGLRFDVLMLSALLIVPLSLSPLLNQCRALHRCWSGLLKVYLCAVLLWLLFMELATPNFLMQFDARPNILFVEYLKYPKEVLAMLWGGFKGSITLAAVMLPVVAVIVWRLLPASNPVYLTWPKALALSLILLCLLGLAVRSSLGHRPANPSVVAFSSDLMVNDIALNSSYSLLYAIYESTRDEKGVVAYGDMPVDTMLALVKAEMRVPASHFITSDIPTLHKQVALHTQTKAKNIVIILEESLGAEFVGSLGGKPLTPNLDVLAEQGLWFEKLYATGTRSVRGIEALITGFTPTAARSVVKLSKSQRGFFSFAEVLRRKGYDTSFIYGGEAHFDNMQRFFINNGFNKIIEQKDYSNPQFVGSWGVSDEDLFSKADELFQSYGDQPFFSLVFSSSNHNPFDFPDDRIVLYDQEKATENNAVKYADYSLGQFFKQAKQSRYWHNTLFLVVADHNSRVRGANLVPIEYFHIPGLIIGGGVQPAVYSKVSSQIDLLPTLLSMAGIDAETPAIGRDLTDPKYAANPGRAIMQYNKTQAYREGDQVVVFERNKPAVQYVYKEGQYTKSVVQSKALLDKALAHAMFGPYAYQRGNYRLPDESLL
ncbi:LTA synthase family protein [Dasania sp. GY-MA-18]|uniref:LTA synthase family protein n=1 Tax=Dasania phycosphaerae TaxID=2950436 RepID=A0A9J6RHC9_9GAMM|nr:MULTISPECIES: LTA synthase family protein [Dasania]MCR8921334.1 LTA synthase family protein [Dasania sp. GY-MA-18]MCZ0863762.1 LTA synthase family protein [Dasania phycosphaerae]MCZ0867490.1 LTA synthase family protein [Dasania phycosphaerae]